MKRRDASAAGQYTLFDYFIRNETCASYGNTRADTAGKGENAVETDKNLANYSSEQYAEDVIRLGTEKTWENICRYILSGDNDGAFLRNADLAEMYETGLALVDKKRKKASGQYFTPDDVASVMSYWFDSLRGENVCDVGCGTGKLILTYLNHIGEKRATEILSKGLLYLYDSDKTALMVCKTAILLRYGKRYADAVHDICGDFLDKKITLPKNCKVICNPPYSAVRNFKPAWDKSEILVKSKETYSAFMEKILLNSDGAVIITPYSFIGGEKFYPLRRLMNGTNGFVVSFDNVPGNIFNGRKHGVFNSNKSNSVRAAITVTRNLPHAKGYRFSPLIRFKNEERANLLRPDVLENFVGEEYQVITEENTKYYKCDKRLERVWNAWRSKSDAKLGAYEKKDGEFCLYVPNTCRYFTVASKERFRRNGQIAVRFANENVCNFLYCLLNSSFSYWYWRMFDGGITFTKGLLLSIPVFFSLLSSEDSEYFNETAREMSDLAERYIVRKNNVGVQENIKFPKKFRDAINRRLLDILGVEADEKIFDIIHSNKAMEIKT